MTNAQTVNLNKEARQIVAIAERLNLFVNIKCEELTSPWSPNLKLPKSYTIEITETADGGDWLKVFYRTDTGRARRVGASGCYTRRNGEALNISPSTLSEIINDLHVVRTWY